MDYKQTLNYLYESTPVFERVGASAYKEGLYNTEQLDEHFEHPHRKFRTIHVAGTNGKGSTSHSLAAILMKAGYKVGLYTSPHLVDFSERIRVNGTPISKQYVIDFVKNNRAFFEPLHPSFFELVTAMAFRYFADEKVDIAVIEVGLGGRLDCTNIITPILSVITNISFDHTGFLGNTLAKIAGEKAGIIKKGVPVVIGEYNDETLPVFTDKAYQMNAPLILTKQDADYSEWRELLQLKGDCQQRNIATIMTAVSELKRQNVIPNSINGDKIVRDALPHVCDLTGLRGRWETICDSPKVICDTGHNVAGWEYLSVQIVSTFDAIKKMNANACLRIVFGMVDDKDIDTVLSMLPKNAKYYFCQASTHRAIPVEKVEEKASCHGLTGMTFHDVKSAYDAAIADSSCEDMIFVGGSSYVVADFLS